MAKDLRSTIIEAFEMAPQWRTNIMNVAREVQRKVNEDIAACERFYASFPAHRETPFPATHDRWCNGVKQIGSHFVKVRAADDFDAIRERLVEIKRSHS
jgi:hypothetical protein